MVFAFVFFQGTRHNQFPFFYHTDEPSKAEQLVSGERNFFHPALMLNSTVAASRLLGVPRECQAMVVTGRTMSAFFAALAIAGFALVAWQMGGTAAGILAGVFCALSADFYDSAHYMKEDPYYISGLSFAFLAALHYWRNPGKLAALLLGLAAGWSVSGKYIGFIALLVATLTIGGKMIETRSRNLTPLLICVLAAAILFLGVNFQILTQPSTMAAGLGKEVGALYNGHHQKDEKFTATRYVDLLKKTVPKPAIALAFGLLGFGLWRCKRRPLPETLFLILPVILGIAISCTPKGSARYFLPIGLMLLTSAGIALGLALNTWKSKPYLLRFCTWTVGAVVAIAILLPLAKEYNIRQKAFAADYRKDLARYISEKVAPDALIASDLRAAMPTADDPRFAGFPGLLPNKMLVTRYVADLGTIDELAAKGVSYVVVANRDANRLANDDNFTAEDQKKLPIRRGFYQELAKRGSVEWQSKLGTNKYLNVSLVLYRIAPKTQ